MTGAAAGLEPAQAPELYTLAAWSAARPERRRALLGAIAAASQGALALVGTATGWRLVTRASGLALCFVPGGTFRMGLSDAEAAALTTRRSSTRSWARSRSRQAYARCCRRWPSARRRAS